MVRRPQRRAFSLVEVLVALTISVILLTATMFALRASFESYRRSAERVSTNVSGRLIIERVQMMIRGGVDFGPVPASPADVIVESNELSVQVADGTWTTIRWDEPTGTVFWEQGGDSWPLLTHTDPPRPDAPYSIGKLFGEATGRWFADRSTRAI